MLKRTYDNQVCSIAGTLELVGERWTLLILRDVFLGLRRFDDLQRELGIARNVLRDRLRLLVDSGILEKHPYQERPQRFEYRLTEKGIALYPVFVAIAQWGDRYLADPAGPPVEFAHRDCGEVVRVVPTCAAAHEIEDVRRIAARPGPGVLLRD